MLSHRKEGSAQFQERRPETRYLNDVIEQSSKTSLCRKSLTSPEKSGLPKMGSTPPVFYSSLLRFYICSTLLLRLLHFYAFYGYSLLRDEDTISLKG